MLSVLSCGILWNDKQQCLPSEHFSYYKVNTGLGTIKCDCLSILGNRESRESTWSYSQFFTGSRIFSWHIFSASPHSLTVFSMRKKMIHFLLFVSPTNWPCEVLIVPEWVHSWPVISYKSTKGGRTSDRWLSYCLLIVGVYLLIIFCIPHRSRNLYSGGTDQTQWGYQFPLS